MTYFPNALPAIFCIVCLSVFRNISYKSVNMKVLNGLVTYVTYWYPKVFAKIIYTQLSCTIPFTKFVGYQSFYESYYRWFRISVPEVGVGDGTAVMRPVSDHVV